MDLSTRPGRREQGQRLQRAIERAGISVEELAGRIGCSRALLYQYLSGSTLAQPDRMQQIAQICGVPLAYFYADETGDAPAETSAVLSPSNSTALPEPGSGVVPPASDVTARLRDSLRALQELAVAQENPPDFNALASTCERILSLSAQVGDRQALARAQRTLGYARGRVSDYPRAVEALTRAITLAQEAGDAESETGARQALGHALLQMGRLGEAASQFAALAEGAAFRGRWQGTLSLGCVDEMLGDYAQAMSRFDQAATLLEEGANTGEATPDEVATGLLYVSTNRVNVYLDEGDFALARSTAERAAGEAEALGVADQHLEFRLDIAWCELFTGQWESVYRSLTNILRLARFVGDRGRETLARAWLGIFLAASGDHDGASEAGKDALSIALSRGDRRAEMYAQLALADAYIAVASRLSEARYHTNQALAVAVALRYERGEIECRLRLAHLAARTGEIGELRDAAGRALALSERLGARHLQSTAHLWTAWAWWQEGDYPAATEEARRALTLADELELAEARWRTHLLLACLRLQIVPGEEVDGLSGATVPLPAISPDLSSEAERELLAAHELLETLRNGLTRAGLADTLLENAECRAVYALLTRLYLTTGRAPQARDFLEQTGWPPLTLQFADALPDADAAS